MAAMFSPPSPPPPPPVPEPEDPFAGEARARSRRAAALRKGMGKTILTSALGVQSDAKTNKKTLLGQ